jgi:hypothetical protein
MFPKVEHRQNAEKSGEHSSKVMATGRRSEGARRNGGNLRND